jgi:predicted Fe-S protein YdhL (DUF1289 family)
MTLFVMADRPARSAPVASPCISVCQLDEHSVCVGCGRLIGEIAEWSRAGEERRREIVTQATLRRRAAREAAKKKQGAA